MRIPYELCFDCQAAALWTFINFAVLLKIHNFFVLSAFNRARWRCPKAWIWDFEAYVHKPHLHTIWRWSRRGLRWAPVLLLVSELSALHSKEENDDVSNKRKKKRKIFRFPFQNQYFLRILGNAEGGTIFYRNVLVISNFNLTFHVLVQIFATSTTSTVILMPGGKTW